MWVYQASMVCSSSPSYWTDMGLFSVAGTGYPAVHPFWDGSVLPDCAAFVKCVSLPYTCGHVAAFLGVHPQSPQYQVGVFGLNGQTDRRRLHFHTFGLLFVLLLFRGFLLVLFTLPCRESERTLGVLMSFGRLEYP